MNPHSKAKLDAVPFERQQQFLKEIAGAADAFISEMKGDFIKAIPRIKSYTTVLATVKYQDLDDPEIIHYLLVQDSIRLMKTHACGFEGVDREKVMNAEVPPELLELFNSLLNYEQGSGQMSAPEGIQRILNEFENLLWDELQNFPKTDSEEQDEINSRGFEEAMMKHLKSDRYIQFAPLIMSCIPQMLDHLNKRAAMEMIVDVLDEAAKMADEQCTDPDCKVHGERNRNQGRDKVH